MEEKHSLLVDHLTTGYFVHAGEIKHERIYLSQCKHIQSFCVGQLSEEETAESDTTEHTSDPSNRFVIYTTGKSPYVAQYSLSSLTKNTNITEYATNIVKGVFNVMSYLSPSLSFDPLRFGFFKKEKTEEEAPKPPAELRSDPFSSFKDSMRVGTQVPLFVFSWSLDLPSSLSSLPVCDRSTETCCPFEPWNWSGGENLEGVLLSPCSDRLDTKMSK